jgi:hypothetical protein
MSSKQQQHPAGATLP